MQPVARLGDAIGHGGVVTGSIISASTNVLDAGVGIARLGDTATCNAHGPSPITVTITSASPKNQINGLGIARVGDSLSCGATIMTGSAKVFSN